MHAQSEGTQETLTVCGLPHDLLHVLVDTDEGLTGATNSIDISSFNEHRRTFIL